MEKNLPWRRFRLAKSTRTSVKASSSKRYRIPAPVSCTPVVTRKDVFRPKGNPRSRPRQLCRLDTSNFCHCTSWTQVRRGSISIFASGGCPSAWTNPEQSAPIAIIRVLRPFTFFIVLSPWFRPGATTGGGHLSWPSLCIIDKHCTFSLITDRHYNSTLSRFCKRLG